MQAVYIESIIDSNEITCKNNNVDNSNRIRVFAGFPLVGIIPYVAKKFNSSAY